MLVQNPEVIMEGRLRTMAREARNGIKTIYMHWTAGHYGQDYDDYHLCIDRDGTVYVNCKHFTEYKTHTWMRNHCAIGIGHVASKIKKMAFLLGIPVTDICAE